MKRDIPSKIRAYCSNLVMVIEERFKEEMAWGVLAPSGHIIGDHDTGIGYFSGRRSRSQLASITVSSVSFEFFLVWKRKTKTDNEKKQKW